MLARFFKCLPALCLIFSMSVHAGESRAKNDSWPTRPFTLGHYDASKWRGLNPLRLTGFYPLGFSKDGWFAYFHHPEEKENPEGTPDLSLGISVRNIRCEGGGECVSDTPTSKGDWCYCPVDVDAKGLARYRVRPLGALKHGSFPAQIGDDKYRVETVYKEGIIPSEMAGGGSFPGTEVYLISEKRGKRLITVIDHNHMSAVEGSIQATGWMETPQEDTIIVLISYAFPRGAYKDSDTYVVFQPVVVNLKKGPDPEDGTK